MIPDIINTACHVSALNIISLNVLVAEVVFGYSFLVVLLWQQSQYAKSVLAKIPTSVTGDYD